MRATITSLRIMDAAAAITLSRTAHRTGAMGTPALHGTCHSSGSNRTMHIFVNEMRWTADNSDDSIDHEERVVSTLTKAFLWLRDHLVEQQQQQPAIHTED
jgi:hypothetical protein